jgi:hypothetical protein
MIELVAELCAAALLAGLTVFGIMVLFLALCVVMPAIAYLLSYDFENVPRLPR